MPLDDGAEIADLSRPFYVRLLELAWVDAAAAGFVDAAFDVDMPEVQEILEFLATRITRVADHTRERVRELVGEAAENGWGVDEIAARFEEAGLFSRDRALKIANFELADAHSRGSVLAWRQSGVVDRKEWIAEADACEICLPLNGMVVALDDEFAPGLLHPPGHPGDCRCAVSPVVADL
jgi:SPP1 gp7 family putative phage head morphogenesis protein